MEVVEKYLQSYLCYPLDSKEFVDCLDDNVNIVLIRNNRKLTKSIGKQGFINLITEGHFKVIEHVEIVDKQIILGDNVIICKISSIQTRTNGKKYFSTTSIYFI